MPSTPSLLAGLPRAKFRCILADPPWAYRTWSKKGLGKSAEKHYRTMDIAAVKTLPVSGYAADDCWLFLWSTGPHLALAFDVMAAWDFKYSGMGFVWVKWQRSLTRDRIIRTDMVEKWLHFGPGHTTRKNAEFCLLGRRGKAKRISASVREVIISPVREHSRKPDVTHERIEQFCEGPRLELFGRRQRPGWVVRGDQVSLFNE